VRLLGELRPWVSAKDVILELLRRMTVKGGVGKVIEYFGSGVATLAVPQRATICNMGAELGATTSVFPSDDRARAYLVAQGRCDAWRPLGADSGAAYDEMIEVDLGSIEPLIARPSSPDNVLTVRELAGLPVAQVCIGSCVNSSFEDLAIAARVLKGQAVHPRVSLTVTPGTRQVLVMIAHGGQLADLVLAGARVLECGCGPCIGMGQAPATGVVSVRSFNRNFKGRSGTDEDQVYLVSVETAAATALRGQITDPRTLGAPMAVETPERYASSDSLSIPPLDAEAAAQVEVVRGPNIHPVPVGSPLPGTLSGKVLLKTGDNITTDQIMPSGADTLPLRSNVPALARHVFSRMDPVFAERARQWGGGIVVAGANYGQGSSREHAALVPMYLGLTAVIAKSFARIHRANLVNAGVLPLVFAAVSDYDRLQFGDELVIAGVRDRLGASDLLIAENQTQGHTFRVRHDLADREVGILLAGGMLNYIRGGGE
jgi:aconitate hydratase